MRLVRSEDLILAFLFTARALYFFKEYIKKI
jgi:hypothetical protein